MKAKIEIVKMKASTAQAAMEKLREKYPYAKLVTYRFEKDFRFMRPKNYKDRIIELAVVKDARDVWKKKYL